MGNSNSNTEEEGGKRESPIIVCEATHPGGEATTSPTDKRPEWMKDTDAESCALCSSEFRIIRRRHHCRACGKLVCDECSSFKIKIPRLDYHTNVRVCDICWVREPMYLYGNHKHDTKGKGKEKEKEKDETKEKKEEEKKEERPQPGEEDKSNNNNNNTNKRDENNTKTMNDTSVSPSKRIDWRKGSRGDVV